MKFIFLVLILISSLLLGNDCINNSACSNNPSEIKIDQVRENNSFYVDPTIGNDNNDGSINSPWKNLQNVINNKISDNTIIGGDIIYLKSGNYGDLVIRGKHNSDFITIKALGSDTSFSTIKIESSSKWRFSGITVISKNRGIAINGEYAPYSSRRTQLVYIKKDASYIIFDHNKFYSDYNYKDWNITQWGEFVNNGIYSYGHHVMIFKNEFRAVNIVILLAGEFSVAIANDIKDFSEDAMRGVANNQLFEGNIIKDCYNINRLHNDGFQSYTSSANNYAPVKNITIRKNKIIGTIKMNNSYGDIGLQGIGCFDGFFENFIIENNVIAISNYHGITLVGAKNSKIINNTVVGTDFVNEKCVTIDNGTTNCGKRIPWIMIRPHKDGRASSSCLIRNNIFSNQISACSKYKVVNGRDVCDESLNSITHDHNIKADLNNVNTLFVNYNNKDFHLKDNTEPINAGVDTEVTDDYDGNSRDGNIDIGAFEFGSSSQYGAGNMGGCSINSNININSNKFFFLVVFFMFTLIIIRKSRKI